MAGKRETFEDVLSKEFDINKFTDFVKEMLTGIRIIAPKPLRPVNDSTFFYYVEGYSHVGTYQSEKGEKIAVFSVALKNGEAVERARGAQRNFAKTLLESAQVNGAIVAYYTKDAPEKWRLSFVRMDYEFAQGKISEKLTPAKRYSYLVGYKEPCNTAKQRLFPIFQDDQILPTLDALEDAFSVDKVTKEFFDLYKIKYFELKEILESNEDFKSESEVCSFTSEQFAKKLIGQIVFLYFVQKKGWLGVGGGWSKLSIKQYNNLYYTSGGMGRVIKEYLPQIYTKNGDEYLFKGLAALDRIPDDAEIEIANRMPEQRKWGEGDKNFVYTLYEWAADHNKNFFNDILEPLFYTTLNMNRGENAYCPFLHCRIPFLNGGLFEELKGYDWKNNDFDIPNTFFSNNEGEGLLDIFGRFNFTMNEDEPMEREVAIDPEMLGKVFENLLDVKDRKSKGAYYTPREIVHYMCQETLINYLQGKMKISYKDIKAFVLYGDLMKDEDTKRTKWIVDDRGKSKCVIDKEKDLFIPESLFSYKNNINRLEEVDELLKNVKIVDLAVGSGAFPLGMLSEIVHVREVITEYLMADMDGINKLSFLNYGRKPYQLKTQTIKNCLYACDLEPSAVDIAKLRLWLSIVIEDEIADKVQRDGVVDEDTKPKQLPNLDCNFVCGNSLIDEFKGNKLITESKLLNNEASGTQQSLFQNGVDVLIDELIKLQDRLFFEKTHEEKIAILKNVNSIYDQIVLEQGIRIEPELRDDYLKESKYPSKPFILWQLYFPKVFKENGGFDIIIGNPPYVGEKGNKEIFRPIAATEFGHKYYQGKMDLFYFFFHKALDLGNKNAEIAFITTNYYPTATGGKNLRSDMYNRAQIRRLVNFNELKVFESALGQHNIITFLTKRKSENISAQNSFCKISGVADANLLRRILYSETENNDYFETRSIAQENLFDGDEKYIRLMGIRASSGGILDCVLNKVAASEKKLAQIADIKQGIVSGADKYTDAHQKKFNLNYPKGKGIFIISSDELASMNIPEWEKEKFIKPVYKNSEITKYHINYRNELYVLYMTREMSETDAPDIVEYLRQFKPLLENRLATYNENYPWFALHRQRDKDILEAPEKIVNSRRAKSNTFALETRQYFEQSDLMVTVVKPLYQKEFPIKYVLGVLNSKLYYIWLKNRGKVKGDLLEMYGTPLEEIPIKRPDDSTKVAIVEAVNKIISHDGNEREHLATIDKAVYSLYGLSEVEIESVEKYNG